MPWWFSLAAQPYKNEQYTDLYDFARCVKENCALDD